MARPITTTRRGFTIAELIVAIGVTLVLLLGVSRIFSMAKETISIGEAIAEINQNARALERLLRRDFDAMSRQGFLVIRNERIGVRLPGDPDRDLDRLREDSPNAWSGQNARFVYLNEDMEEQDEGANPLEADHHLGLRRLDQLVFFSTGDFTTNQYRNMFGGVGIARNDTAPVARIWYGHGLRDRDFYDPDQPGEIKSGVGVNEYESVFADPTRRDPDIVNKYADRWILARQPALLLPRSSVINAFELNFVSSAIEYFNEVASAGNQFTPLERLSPGLVDLIDQDLVDVEKAITEYGYVFDPATGTFQQQQDPFGGFWDLHAGARATVDAYVQDPNDRARIGDDVAETWAIAQRLRMMFSTGRIRTESAPPTALRADQMVTHATMLEGVSSFEVAWSTGESSYPEGDLVWYDIDNPANPYLAGWDFNEHELMDRRQRREQAPEDPRAWYLGEVPPDFMPRSGLYGESAWQDIYYANFGYFVPKEDDADRNELWPWPKMIRVRVTMHDSSGAIPTGRDFEYVFKTPETVSGR
ncbi:MAG: PilW family protein [Phycisphaerales bacterium]